MAQKIRGKKEREAREYDRTSLRSNSHGLWIHRDYAAHFFRWGFAKRFIKPTTSVLDIGCGVEAPLVNVLTPSLSHVPQRYVGVDMNKLPRTPNRQWATYHERFDATNTTAMKKLGTFDVVISYESIEHMPKAKGKKLLCNMRMVTEGVCLLSTPVYDGVAKARNHVHEYTVAELQNEILNAGFTIEDRFGTFARQRDIKEVAEAYELQVAKDLSAFYDDDVIACFLAPMYPDASRNNLWVLR